MNAEQEVLSTLDEALSLQGRSAKFTRETQLLGAVPELDSMAVITVVTSLEERFDITVEDDELDAAVFETVGSLVRFVESKLEEA
ncbi:phosphopantetheine-binding protein [Lentisalinibacter salinarum]|uniref:phosphopantetheine-binding protein n=1 Tax=Lentisalinibacter salinarum TaxID=2992239 RepID=UPI0038707553